MLHKRAFLNKDFLQTYCSKENTPPLKKAIPRSLGSTISQKPCSKRTPTDSEYDVG